MQFEQTPSDLRPTTAGSNDLAEPSRPAWTVKFVAPTPKAMPAERLKARAERARTALISSTY
jgi:hypothetical protein